MAPSEPLLTINVMEHVAGFPQNSSACLWSPACRQSGRGARPHHRLARDRGPL